MPTNEKPLILSLFDKNKTTTAFTDNFFLFSGLEAQVQESSKDLYWF